MIYRKYIKRPMDFALALIALIVLSPLLLIETILVRTCLGRPVLFKQQRPGKDEKIFTLYKFRTLTNETDKNGVLLPDKSRLKKFGCFLRASSLDELPELWNILRGDMSIIGPRPLLVEYLPLYNDRQRRRHEVRPGLSGLSQVNGRNSINWEEKFELDVRYVDNICFISDMVLILKTLLRVLKREGINSATSATMEPFTGCSREGEKNMNNSGNGSNKKLLIIGAGGHGKVVADIALKMNKWKSVSFLDDNNDTGPLPGLEILDKSTNANKYIKDSDLIVAIGNNKTRERLQRELEMAGASIPILIHPSAVVGRGVEIGIGTVVMAGAVINSGSSIGKGCIINTSASIDHDNKLGDYVHISPGVHTAGNVIVGSGAWLGIGSVVSNDIKITDGCTIGAGSLVIKDINEIGTYIGHPTTRIKK